MSEEIIESSFDFVRIVNNSLELTILKELFVEQPFHKFISFPSLNIYNEKNTNKFLNKLAESQWNNILNEDIQKLANSDNNMRKYNILLNNLLERYD